LTALSLEQIDVDASFAVWGRAATYVPPGGGTPIACTVIVRNLNKDHPEFSGRPIKQGHAVEVRLSELASPAAGGRFMVGTASYVIVGQPALDAPDNLVWTCRTG
jgi:hypothetical protein